MLGQCVYNGWRMGFCVRKSGSSERVAYGPKPRENALSRVLSAPHSPDDFSRMHDGAVGGNPLNGAFLGVQATLHASLSHPPIRCHHTPRATKRLGRPFLSDCVASSTAGRTPSLVVVRCGEGSCRPIKCCCPWVLAANLPNLPNLPTFHTGHAERESGRVCGGLCDLLTGAGGRQSPPCCSRRSKSNSPRGECHDPSLGGLAIFA